MKCMEQAFRFLSYIGSTSLLFHIRLCVGVECWMLMLMLMLGEGWSDMDVVGLWIVDARLYSWEMGSMTWLLDYAIYEYIHDLDITISCCLSHCLS